ncbi:hypothetical protein ACW9HQ_46560, partial [Nocardia gipuzkoensis]
MSQNEVDQIGRETGSVFRSILEAGRAYIRSVRQKDRYPGVKRLNATERRELAERIRAQVGEERIAAAWFTKRVEDYRREAAHFQILKGQHETGSEAWRQLDNVAQNRLEGMRYSIESSLHNSVLRFEHRGQVAQALDMVHSYPGGRVWDVFPKLDSETAREAREYAVQSERWVTDRRDRTQQLLEQQQFE